VKKNYHVVKKNYYDVKKIYHDVIIFGPPAAQQQG